MSSIYYLPGFYTTSKEIRELTTSDVNLLDYLPSFYGNIKEFQELTNVQGYEVDELKASIEDLINQLFVDNSTWGLSYWEEARGIQTDESKPIEDRRSVVKSKIRGVGTVTTELIKEVTDSFTNGQVEVIEKFSTNSVEIRFNSQLGAPPNIDDAKKALREIIPAHLGIEYVFRYLFINEIHNVMTLNDLQNTTLDKFAGGD